MKKIILILGLAISCSLGFSQETGSFTDPRDGNVYKTVKIGTQWMMAENLAYKPASGIFWAYNNDTNNVAKYGYLYDWNTAQSIAPAGWHLPSKDEWKTLYEFLGGKSKIVCAALSEKGSSGFNALLGGYRQCYGVFMFIDIGNSTYFWGSSGTPWCFGIYYYLKKGNITMGPSRVCGLNVRLFKDN